MTRMSTVPRATGTATLFESRADTSSEEPRHRAFARCIVQSWFYLTPTGGQRRAWSIQDDDREYINIGIAHGCVPKHQYVALKNEQDHTFSNLYRRNRCPREKKHVILSFAVIAKIQNQITMTLPINTIMRTYFVTSMPKQARVDCSGFGEDLLRGQATALRTHPTSHSHTLDTHGGW